MMNKRCSSVVAGCLLLFAPAVAWAVAGEGIQVGPTLLYPALSVTGTYDDNFHQASSNPVSGWETTIAPSLRLVMPVQRFYLNAEAGVEFLNYYDLDAQESTDWFFGGAVGADFPGGLSFKVADKQTQTYLTATQEYPNPEDYTENDLSATVGFVVRNALKLELSANRLEVTYDVSENRTRVENGVRANLYWKFRPTLSVGVGGSYNGYAYDTNTRQDSTETRLGVGLTWDVTARSTGDFKFGYEWKAFDVQDASLGTEDAGYYIFSLGLLHSFTQRTALRIDLSRASQESDFPQNPYYLETMLGASLSLRLTTKLYGKVGVSYTRDEYPQTASYVSVIDNVSVHESGERTDTTLLGSISLGFDVTRWLSFEVAYEAEQRDSNFKTFDYDQNRVSLSAKAAF